MANTLPVTLGATRTLEPITPVTQAKTQRSPLNVLPRKEDSVILSPQALAALSNHTVQGSGLDRLTS